MAFFREPKEIWAETWLDLPTELNWKKRSNARVEKFVGKPTHSFLEGPSFDRKGNLYVVDFAFGRIVRISPDGVPETVCEYDGAPNGLQIGLDGLAYVSDRELGIVRIDPAIGSVDVLCGREQLSPGYQGLSDITIARNGDIFFTDQGDSHLLEPTGRVLRLSANGEVQVLMTRVPGPNGIVLNPQETHLFVAITYGPAVWRARLRPDGGVDKVGVFQSLPGGYSGTDGLAMDEEGGLAACHNRLGTVWLFDPQGEPTYRVRAPKHAGSKITNVAYGSANNAKLFMTEAESGKILVAEAPVPGHRTVGQLENRTGTAT